MTTKARSKDKGPQSYVVERIVTSRKEKNSTVYLIKWKGYSDSQNTWEPLKHLSMCGEMVDEFNRAKRIKRARELDDCTNHGDSRNIASMVPSDQSEMHSSSSGEVHEIFDAGCRHHYAKEQSQV